MKKPNTHALCRAAASTLFLTGICGFPGNGPVADAPTPPSSYTDDTLTEPRRAAQRTAALRFGAQQGLHDRADAIRTLLDTHGTLLHSIYNFSPLLVDGYLLPPVVTRGRRLFIQNDPRSARETGQLYRIIRAARITQSPPFWQDYLHFTIPIPQKPYPALLPKNKGERDWWHTWQVHGRQLGIDQADTIFKQNLARLHRDYTGMLHYHRLYRLGVIQAPKLSKTPYSTIRDVHSLRVRDRTMRLGRDAGFSHTAQTHQSCHHPCREIHTEALPDKIVHRTP